MEFGLSQDQLMLGDSVRKFLASEVPLDKVRQLAAVRLMIRQSGRVWPTWDLLGSLSPRPWRRRARHAGRRRHREALGYAACPAVLSTAIMSAYLLNAAGATDPLAAMASGEYRVGIAFSDVIGSRKGQVTEADPS